MKWKSFFCHSCNCNSGLIDSKHMLTFYELWQLIFTWLIGKSFVASLLHTSCRMPAKNCGLLVLSSASLES